MHLLRHFVFFLEEKLISLSLCIYLSESIAEKFLIFVDLIGEEEEEEEEEGGGGFCMTSASELFYSRRYRIGGNRNDTELGLDSSSTLDRNLNHQNQHNRRRYHIHQHYQHRQHQQRRELEQECNPIVRRSPRHRGEHEPVRVDYGTSQSSAGSSSSTEVSSRSNRQRFSTNDRLPGDVLLARERLLERLRGVSLSGNRQNNRASSRISFDEYTYNEDFRLVGAGDWETETPREWLAGVTPSADSSTQTDLFLSSSDSTPKRTPGLSREEVNCLHRELFNELKSDGTILAVAECSICLEKFEERDSLISLPCGHRFHSLCIDPWVRKCGDCPYCRTCILLGPQKIGKRAS